MIAFAIGYTIMFFNEGFVIMRHVHPWFAEKRQQLHDRFGAKRVKRVHGLTDWTWIILLSIGIYLDFENWKWYAGLVFAFWFIVGVGVYLPMLIKKLFKKSGEFI